jgi:hypothetical protein
MDLLESNGAAPFAGRRGTASNIERRNAAALAGSTAHGTSAAPSELALQSSKRRFFA